MSLSEKFGAASQPRNCAFNFDRCGGRLTVYVYASEPHTDVHDHMYHVIRTMIDRSVLQWSLVDDPSRACLFICPLGFYHNLDSLQHLPYWNGGENHLIWDPWDFDRVDRRALGRAMLATSNSVWHGEFDRACDIYVPVGAQRAYRDIGAQLADGARKYLATFRGSIADRFYGGKRKRMLKWNDPEHRLIVSDSAAKGANGTSPMDGDTFVDLLNSTFALIPDGNGPATFRLIETMAAGIVPIFVDMDMYVAPFHELVPWHECSLAAQTSEFVDAKALWRALTGLPDGEVERMRACVNRAYDDWLGPYAIGNSVLLSIVRLLERQRPDLQLCFTGGCVNSRTRPADLRDAYERVATAKRGQETPRPWKGKFYCEGTMPCRVSTAQYEVPCLPCQRFAGLTCEHCPGARAPFDGFRGSNIGQARANVMRNERERHDINARHHLHSSDATPMHPVTGTPRPLRVREKAWK